MDKIHQERMINILTEKLIEVFKLLNTRDYAPGEVKGILLYVLVKVSNFKNLNIDVRRVGDFLKNGALRNAWMMLSHQVYWLSESPNLELMDAIREADLDSAVEEVRTILSFDSSDLDIKEKQRLVGETLNKKTNTLFFQLSPKLKQFVLDKAFYLR